MRWGCQTLKTVVQDAGKYPDRLELDFGVPVLILSESDLDDEPHTVVTAAGRTPIPAPPPRAATSNFVVPLQPRDGRKTTEPRLSFGRSEVCDVVLPFGPVSKHHGFFVAVTGGWQLVDVGSTNGSTVNGRPLAPNQPQLLSDGADINFGALQARYLSGPSFVTLLRQQLSLPR